MSNTIILPKQGWSMEEATFVEWLPKEGQHVNVGDLLFSIETDKAVQEIEALDSGILHLLPKSPQPGSIIKVGEVIGYLLQPGESAPADISELAAPVSKPEMEPTIDPEPVATVDPEPVAPVEPTAANPLPPVIECTSVTPRAAQRAMAACLDLRTIKGSGRGGRIRESDVIEAAERSPSEPIAQPSNVSPAVAGSPSGSEIPITSLRRTIADRMHRSKSVTAPVTLTARVDATIMAKLRADWKAAAHHEILPSYSDMIMKLVSGALLKHPPLNARWEETRIVQPDSVNIGLAVDTPEGLLVPVVRDVQELTLGHLAKKTTDLVERARQRRLSPEELRGGTFTISSLGGMGVDLFTPIINHPECAVLGIGRIVREPVAVNEAVVLRDRMWLSLTFDHRVVDGAPAARFLETLGRAVEDPLAWLVA